MGEGEREMLLSGGGPVRKRSVVKRLLIGGVSVLALLLVGAVVVAWVWGPGIASGVVRRAIPGAAAGAIVGPVSVDDVRLSWSGPQNITGVRLRDPKGDLVAELNISATTSLSALVFGSRDVGEIRVGGTVNVTKDGAETSLQRATKPVVKAGSGSSSGGAPPSGGPSRLPSTLAGKFVLDGLTINYTDSSAPSAAAPGGAAANAAVVRTASIPGMKGEASFAVGKPLLVNLTGDGQVDGRPMRVRVDITADGLTSPDGLLTPERLKVDGTIDATLPSALLAGLPVSAGAAPALEAVFAPDAAAAAKDTTLAVKANGDAKAIDATVALKAPGATLEGALRATDIGSAGGGRLTTVRPLIAEVAVTPRVFERVQKGPDGKGAATASLAEPIRATATIELDAPLAATGSLKGAMIRAALQTTEARGAVTLPGNERPAQFSIAPLTATMDAPDLAGPLTLKANTEATLDGQRAGSFGADIRAAGLLDASGKAKPGMPQELSGVIELKGFATAIAQPMVANAGLDLARDVGPTLDAVVRAEAKPGVAGANASPGTEITAQVKSRNVSLDAALAADDGGVRLLKDGATARIADVTPTLAAFLAKSGVRVEGPTPGTPTPATLTVTALDAPFRKGAGGAKEIDMAALRAVASLTTGGLRATTQGDPTPLSVAGLKADVALAPGAPAKLTLDGKGDFGGEPFSLAGDLAVAGLIAKDGSINAAARPTGTVTVTDAPIALAGLAGLGDRIPLLKQAIGPKVGVRLVASAADGGASDVKAEVSAANLTASAETRVRDDRVEVRGARAKTTLTPTLIATALSEFAPEMTDKPALLAPAVFTAEIGAMNVPLAQGKPDLAKATPLKVKAGIEGEGARIKGVSIGGQPPLEALLKGLSAEATWSLAEGGPREATAKADLIDLASGAMIAAFEGGGKIGPGGAIDGSVTLDRLDTAKVDSVIGKPGLLSGALGSPATIAATVKPQGGKGTASMAIDARVKSPKLTTAAALIADDTKIELTSPMEAAYTLDPAWAAANVFGGDAQQAGFALTAPVALTARVERLAISRGSGAPLKPGVFALAANIKAPSVALTTADGAQASMTGVDASVRSAEKGGLASLAFDLGIAGVTGKEKSGAAQQAGKTALRGTIDGVGDAEGKPTPDTARVTLDGDGQLPTALVDALANQKGGLVELLGPLVNVKLSAKDLSKRAGRLSADATAARADAKIAGRIEGGVFYAEAPVTARVHEFTQEFAARTFEAAMPLLSNLEKKREDGPATATITGLEMPIEPEIDTNGDGKPDAQNLRKLNGDVRVELGATRYAASDLLGHVLKATKNNTEGKLFKNFPPLDVKIRQGVASYEKTRFPIGEFEIETRGKVDLADKQMDLIVYLPILAVADEVAGTFKLAPGLGDLTMLPFRIKGPIGSAVPVPAPDLLAKDLFKDFEKSPEKILEGAGNIIGDILKKKKN